MTTRFTLLGHAEKLAPSGSYPAEWKQPHLLFHQIRTWEALRDHPIVINTYNTGTGKTRASLLRLFDLNQRRVNVLFVAPTNALIEQHTADIRQFVQDHELAYAVKPVRADDITVLQAQVEEQTNVPLRRGEILYRLMRNPRELDADILPGHALVMVTNPDIFYYALYFHYGSPHDQLNIAFELIKKFDYIIVDEFHYYSNRQLASFLAAFTLFDQFGYFAVQDRRVCLLSATPRDNVLRYFRDLFEDQFIVIAPENEPAESNDYETVPVLAPLEVTVQPVSLSEWIRSSAREVAGWMHEGLDGAVISSSLARINDAFRELRRYVNDSQMSRITGPEPEAARQAASSFPLILATPTVDIGYNFDRRGKDERQNIDFVVCDARFRDELIQRMGRAGRVLRKKRCDIPSRAVLLLPENVALGFEKLDGQVLSRSEFSAFVQSVDALPHKHQLEGYLRSYAMYELFWPIYRLRRAMTSESLPEIDELYARLCRAFAPDFEHRQLSLAAYMRKYEKRRQWLAEARRSPRQAPKGTAVHLADWLVWACPDKGRPDANALQPYLAPQWQHPHKRQELIAFVESQVALTEALFQFRDSFQGVSVVCWDPEHLFSSEDVNVYDLFHLLSNYHLSPPMSQKQFRQMVGGTEPPQAEFYCRLGQPRETPLRVEFVLDTPMERADFEQRWACLPVAIRGLRIQLREPRGDVVTGGVPGGMEQALADMPVVMLIVPPDLGYVRTRFKGTELWPRELTVNFEATAEQVGGYLAFLGTAAFEAHAELKRDFWLRLNRQRDQAIIL